tara:strand:- start:356 stop:691 length:336 start_codon:yes stop_codon:yes gene_type:complete
VFAEWVEFGNSDKGKFYINFDTIKIDSGYLYFWQMQDYSNVIDEFGNMSDAVYIMSDCSLNRIKTLSYIWYKKPMGLGEYRQEESYNKDWKYPAPGSVYMYLLDNLCDILE